MKTSLASKVKLVGMAVSYWSGNGNKKFFTFDVLKRAASILLLFVFGAYAFTFKSHYCYHHDGTRFHGDCGEFMRGTEKNGHSAAPSIYEQKYVCYDVQLNKHYQQQDHTFKTFNDFLFIVPPIPELPTHISTFNKPGITVFPCRGGPPLVTRFLRGPPLV